MNPSSTTENLISLGLGSGQKSMMRYWNEWLAWLVGEMKLLQTKLPTLLSTMKSKICRS